MTACTSPISWRSRRRAPNRAATSPSGRYLYTPEIYPALRRRWERHGGGEFNYTEGVEELARQGRVVIQRMVGRRLDIGSPAGYLRSILEYAARDPELAAEIESFRAADPAGADSAAGTS